MFRRVLTSLSLVIGFLTFQAFANTMNFEKYELRPYVLTSYLNSENQAYPSYSIKYSFFEMTMDKIYYIYDKKNTNKVLYKFVSSMGGKASLYKKIDGDNYKKILSFERESVSFDDIFTDSAHANKKSARDFGYLYTYNVMDENNTMIAHLYVKKLKPWYQLLENDYTGGFELRSLDNSGVLIQGSQPDNQRYRMELMVAPKLSKVLLLAVSNFMIPHTEVHVPED